ncbi:hypothetical protein [Nocardia flavorosea]|uniref:Guanylate cyclase n=1 Tax=Nocardia flavorosea TaxID=53429 RepID=A0A846YCD6_9NOCA|nr:hypothetical protein [Nocardia flavorosea]NKY54848.1 hypothetical protein [Nocardia flavorosea]
MAGADIDLDRAVEITRTGDIWLFRGHSTADRMIRMTTNSPVNHVGMAVVIDDLPALIWHAELGRSLTDMWSGTTHRGAQLHNLRDAVMVWANKYGQQAWLRQLDPPAGPAMEDGVLRTVARLDGTPFPSTAALAGRWFRGRIQLPRRRSRRPRRPDAREVENAYCAEIVAATYQAMGLLPEDRSPDWYDPGRFWSGDHLRLTGGHTLGGEVAVDVPDETTS